MMIMASANDLIVVFLALEILSIALYVLAAFDRRRLESQEAGLKYFVLGAFSSAVFLYGIALTYGATGTTVAHGDRAVPRDDDAARQRRAARSGIAFLLVGLGFKVAAAPFHMWTPDVYQGAPTPVTAFMAGGDQGRGVRRASCASSSARSRCTASTGGRRSGASRCCRCSSATIAAIVQTDVKRMLAYSSIAHAGYVLIGVQAATRGGNQRGALLPARVRVHGDRRVRDRHGRRPPRRRPPRARGRTAASRRASRCSRALLTLFLLAQAGVPLTGGFVAKLVVFDAAVDARPVPARADRDARRGDRRVRLPAHRARRCTRRRRPTKNPAPSRCRRDGSASTRVRPSRSRSRRAVSSSSASSPDVVLDFARDATQLLG